MSHNHTFMVHLKSTKCAERLIACSNPVLRRAIQDDDPVPTSSHFEDVYLITRLRSSRRAPLKISHLDLGVVGHNLLAVLVVSNTWGRSTVTASDTRANTIDKSALRSSQDLPVSEDDKRCRAGKVLRENRRECFPSTTKALLKHIRHEGAVVIPAGGETTYRTILP